MLERTEICHRGAPAASGLISEPGRLLAQILRPGDVVGVDLYGASYGNVQVALDCQPDLHLRDATAILHAARAVKSEVEVAAMRRANAIAVEVLRQVPDHLRTGLTEAELAADLDGAAR